MAKAPYYKIYLNNTDRDITDTVKSFTYEDSCEEDSLLTLVMHTGASLELADDPEMVPNNLILFQFGYIEGFRSEVQKARITNVGHVYGLTISMSVKCLGIGQVLKRTSDDTIWNGSSIDIATIIAKRYNLELTYDKTTTDWEEMPQGNRSDFEFLKYLSRRESPGDYVFYIRSGTMFFVRRKMLDDSKRTFNYRDPDGVVLEFRADWKEAGADGMESGAGIDNVVVDSTNEEDTGNVSEYETVWKYDALGELVESGISTVVDSEVSLGSVSNGVSDIIKNKIACPVGDETEKKSLGNNVKKRRKKNVLVGSLEIEGDPTMQSNTIITVGNVAKAHMGNWWVRSVTHKITAKGGYRSSMRLNRNGSKSKTTEPAKTKNDSTGAKTNDTVVKVHVYDANGNPVEDVSGSGTIAVTKKK